MRRRLWVTLAFIAVIFVFALYVALPGTPGLPIEVAGRDLSDLRFRQGLDLQGGLHVRFQASPPPEQQLQDGDMDAVKRIIENRVNALGVAEPLIQIEGDNRLIVELPGVEDPEEAIRLFRQTGQLLVINTGFDFIDEGTLLPADASQTVLRGRDLRDARVGFDSLGASMIEFDLQPDAANRFQTYTASHLNEVLTITVDDVVISSARIEAAIRESGVIRGSFTADEARNVAIQLRYGALPVPLEVVETLSVRPTLGQESLEASLRAGLVGALLVLIFMVAFYRVPGVVAAVALVVYTSVVFAVFKLIPVTLTLSGLAGFILSVGVAVDANILIFERTREELRAGRAMRGAIESGFNRAWTSIRDSNISTLIICAVLFGFGSGGVRGFAVTLAIGVAVSMFSAITVSRNLLRMAITWRALTQPRYLRRRRKRRDLMFAITSRRGWWYLLSLALLLPGVVALLTGGLKPGIDFTGGSLIRLRFDQAITQQAVQAAALDGGYPGATVQLTEDNGALVRTPPLEIEAKNALVATIVEQAGPGQELSFSTIGPVVGAELTRAAAIAVAVASVLILLYIMWAFRRMERPVVLGLAAIGALLHDALFLLGLFALLGHVVGVQVDALFVTAILTVIGFSVNDTIVVFDRIRENRQRHLRLADAQRPSFEQTVNFSANQSLTRSLNTSLTALLVLLALIVLGGPTIRLFVVALAAGFMIGTYSSIFAASSALVSWDRRDVPRIWERIKPRWTLVR